MEVDALRKKAAKQRNEIGRLTHQVQSLKDNERLLVHDVKQARRKGRLEALNLVLAAIEAGATTEQLRQFILEKREDQ